MLTLSIKQVKPFPHTNARDYNSNLASTVKEVYHNKLRVGQVETFWRCCPMANFKFDSTSNEAFDALKTAIIENRKSANVIMEYRKCLTGLPEDGGEHAAMLDAFTRDLGYNGIGENWIQIDNGTALRILIHALSKGLAYGMLLMDNEQANDFANQFLNMSTGCSLFTNGDCIKGEIKSIKGKSCLGFSAITEHTLDTGIVAVGTESIAILWTWGED